MLTRISAGVMLTRISAGVGDHPILFITMIPIDCKITKFSLYLYCIAFSAGS